MIVKKILFTIIYPIWFFLANTWVGNALTMVFCVTCTPLVIFIAFPQLEQIITPEEVEGFAGGMVIFSFMIAPIAGWVVGSTSEYLEKYYYNWGYKTEWF